MNLLMIGGDRTILQGKKGAFWYTLDALRHYWDRIDVVCPSISSETRNEQPITRNPFPNVFFHPSPRGMWYQPWWIFEEGRRIVAQYHSAVCTVHAYPPFHHVIGALLLRARTRIPILLEIHGLVGYPHAASWIDVIGRIMTRRILPIVARSANAVRVINAGLQSQLASWGVPIQHIKIIPSFYCDRSVWYPDVSVHTQYDFVFCARLDRNKGLRSVLHALAKVPAASLLVVGEGADRAPCESLARRLGIASRITWVGWIAENTAVATLYRQARVFLQMARSEGGPRTALEAMACGLPVISTAVGVMPDVLREGGNGLFTTGDPADLEEKMRQILVDDGALARMGEAAAGSVGGFEREVLIQRYSDTIQSLSETVAYRFFSNHADT